MSTPESRSTPKQSSSEPAQSGDGENRDATRPAGASPESGQFEQSVALAPEFEATESRPKAALVRFLSRVTPDAFDVNHVVEDLRAMIEETVRREAGSLRREVNASLEGFRGEVNASLEGFRGEMNARFEALRGEMNARFEALESKFEARFKAIESQISSLRWMMGVTITLLVGVFATLVALIVLVVNLAYSEDRSGTPLPPPRTATVQVPAEAETASQTGGLPGSENPELAAPSESSDTADPPADQPAP